MAASSYKQLVIVVVAASVAYFQISRMTSVWEGRLSVPTAVGGPSSSSRDFGLAKTALSRGLDRSQFILTESRPLNEGWAGGDAPMADPVAAGPLQGRARLIVLAMLRAFSRMTALPASPNASESPWSLESTVPASTLVIDAFDCTSPLAPGTAEAAGRRPTAQQAAVMRERDRHRGSKRRDTGILSGVMSLFDSSASGSGIDKRHGGGPGSRRAHGAAMHPHAAADIDAPLLIARLHPALLSDAAEHALLAALPNLASEARAAAGQQADAATSTSNEPHAAQPQPENDKATKALQAMQLAREAWAAWCTSTSREDDSSTASDAEQPEASQGDAAADLEAAFEEFAAAAAAGGGPGRGRGRAGSSSNRQQHRSKSRFAPAVPPGRPPRPGERSREREIQREREREKERERQLQQERRRSKRELLSSVGAGVGSGPASPARDRDRDAQCGATAVLPAKDFEAWLRPALQPSLGHVLSVLAAQRVAALTLSCDGIALPLPSAETEAQSSDHGDSASTEAAGAAHDAAASLGVGDAVSGSEGDADELHLRGERAPVDATQSAAQQLAQPVTEQLRHAAGDSPVAAAGSEAAEQPALPSLAMHIDSSDSDSARLGSSFPYETTAGGLEEPAEVLREDL